MAGQDRLSKEVDSSDLKQGVDSFPSSEKMEELIKIRYEGSFQRQVNIDDKANNMMGIAATVATLYGGFGLVSATALFRAELDTVNLSVFTLLIGVGLMVSCILFSAKSYSIRDYYYAMKVDSFIELKENDFGGNNKTKEDSGKNDDYNWDDKTIDDFRKIDPIELSKLMIKIHLGAIISNRKINDRKSKYLTMGQNIFFLGIATVPIFILVTSLNLD